jgi:hypothetical protein
MPFLIDVSNPLDDALISGYPANERANRTTLKNVIIVEHDEGSGHHKLPAGTIAARDAITDWPATGPVFLVNSGTPPKQLQHRNSSSWETILPYGVGTTTARDALTNVPTNYTWFNTTLGNTQYWDGAAWQTVSVAQNPEVESVAINGFCQVWQKNPSASGVSCPNGADTFAMDRFYVLPTGGTATVNRMTATLPTDAVSNAGIEIVAAAGITQIKYGTRISGSLIKRLGALKASGKPVFWTAKIRHTGTITNITPTLKVYTTNQSDDALNTKFATANVTERRSTPFSSISSGNSATLTDTFDIADSAVIGGNAEYGLEVAILFTGLTGSANEKITITDFWFGAGSVAPTLRFADFQTELERCFPYYDKTFNYSVAAAANSGSFLGAIWSFCEGGLNKDVATWGYKTEMRGIPSVTTFNPGAAGASWRDEANVNSKTLELLVTGSRGAKVALTGGDNYTAYAVHAQADAEWYD